MGSNYFTDSNPEFKMLEIPLPELFKRFSDSEIEDLTRFGVSLREISDTRADERQTDASIPYSSQIEDLRKARPLSVWRESAENNGYQSSTKAAIALWPQDSSVNGRRTRMSDLCRYGFVRGAARVCQKGAWMVPVASIEDMKPYANVYRMMATIIKVKEYENSRADFDVKNPETVSQKEPFAGNEEDSPRKDTHNSILDFFDADSRETLRLMAMLAGTSVDDWITKTATREARRVMNETRRNMKWNSDSTK